MRKCTALACLQPLCDATADKPPEQRDPTKELGQYGRYTWQYGSMHGNWLDEGSSAAVGGCPVLTLTRPPHRACPWCRCGESAGKYPFRTCTVKRVPDPASPPLYQDDSKDWASGAVV
jgi:hypothetical protein